MFRRPRALAAGDRVAIVAPASPFDREEFDRGVLELERLGFEAVVDERVFARRTLVAGDPALRAAHLTEVWRDPSIAGIVCARGGYGSLQLLPLLDAAVFARGAKVFVGYSDITTLLAWLSAGLGLVAFHGPMLAGRLSHGPGGPDPARYDADSLLQAVSRAEPAGRLGAPELVTLKSGEAVGPLLGGTLTQLVGSLGTPFAFDPPDGYVLFVDEVGERPYRLDRMLTQARLAGLLARASAIVFNELPGCDEPGGQVLARDVVQAALDDFTGPVVLGLPSGHTTGAALTLPFGVRTRVIACATPAVILEEAAVLPRDS